MMQFQARLFAPGEPGAGRSVAVHLDALQLRVEGRAPVPLSQLGLRAAGFNAQHWELSWTEGGAPLALLVEDAQTLEALRRQPPAALQTAITALQRQRRSDARWRTLGLSGIVLWLLLPVLLLLALIAAAGPIAAQLARWVPVAQEEQLGEWVFGAQALRLPLLRDTPANAAVADLGARLSAGSRYRYRWHIVRDPALNAFAIPGGIIVVHSGLIAAAESAEELAGVLAHEIEHVEQRHSLKALLRQAGVRVAFAALLGDPGLTGEAAQRLSDLKFSRDHERDADLRAVQRLAAAGIPAEGMVRMFEKLGAQRSGPMPPAWLSTHPATTERIAQLRAASAAAPVSRPLELRYDWPAIRAAMQRDQPQP